MDGICGCGRRSVPVSVSSPVQLGVASGLPSHQGTFDGLIDPLVVLIRVVVIHPMIMSHVRGNVWVALDLLVVEMV